MNAGGDATAFHRRRQKRRFSVAARLAAGVALALALTGLVAAPRLLSGAPTGHAIGWLLPKTRGQIAVGGATWTWPAVWQLVRGRPAPITVDHVRIVDPEGTVVLAAERIGARLEVHRSPWRVAIHDAVISRARWRFAQMKNTPAVGFLAAFQPGWQGARPPAVRGRGTALRADGVRLDGLDATFDFEAWGVALQGVRGSGDIALGADGALRFEVRDADVAAGGNLRVLGGTAALQLPFSHARLERIGTSSSLGGGDADSILVQASGVTTGRSSLALDGRFLAVLGGAVPVGGPALDLVARIARPADALMTLGGRYLPDGLRLQDGVGSSLTASFRGPLGTPVIAVDAQGLHAAYRGVDVPDVVLDGVVDLADRRWRLRRLALTLGDGRGRLEIAGTVDDRRITTRLDFQRLRWPAIADSPAFVGTLTGGVLHGNMALAFDRSRARLSVGELALDWTRPPGSTGPRTIILRGGVTGLPAASPGERRRAWRLHGAGLSAGVLEIPAVTVPLAGGRLQARGRVRLLDRADAHLPVVPTLDVAFTASHVSLADAFGQGFVTGFISLRVRAHGPLDDIAISVAAPAGQRIRVLGEPYLFPARASLRLGQRGLSIAELRLDDAAPRAGGAATADRWLSVAGTIALDGTLDLALTMAGFPFGGLPALAEAALPFSGRLSGALRVRGEPGEHVITGALSVESALFQGRPIGGGRLTIAPRPHGAIQARGSLIDGVDLDGVLEPGARGLRGHARLTLADVRLDPFLAGLPGDMTAAGIVSGQVEVRLAAGQPSVDARLTRLGLSVTIPWLAPAPASARADARAAGARTIALDAVGEVLLSAGKGDLQLRPARLTGPAGTFEIAAEDHAGISRGRVKGRLDLSGLAPLALRWLDQLAGIIELDLAATANRATDRPTVNGFLAVASPLSAAIPGVPFGVRVPTGRMQIDGAGGRLSGLSVVAGGATFQIAGGVTLADGGSPALAIDVDGTAPAAFIQRLIGQQRQVRVMGGAARASARVEGTVAHPRWHGRIVPVDLEMAAPALGGDPLRVSGGEITVDADAVRVRDVDVQFGTAVHATLGAARPGVVLLQGFAPPRVRWLRLPLAGTITALTTPSVVIDEGIFAIALSGDPERALRLSGDLELHRAHVRSAAAAAAGSGDGGNRSGLPPIELALRIHSQPGAVTVNVPHAPDVTVGLDLQARGTASHPQISGRVHPVGIYSRLAVLLYRLFH